VPVSGNPSFPLSEPSTLWRYVSIDKFRAMLVDDALFFSRLDYLGGPSSKGRSTAQEPVRRPPGGRWRSKLAVHVPQMTADRNLPRCVPVRRGLSAVELSHGRRRRHQAERVFEDLGDLVPINCGFT